MKEAQLKLGQKLFKELEIARKALEQAKELKSMDNHYSLCVPVHTDGSGTKVNLSGLGNFNEKLKGILVDELESFIQETEKEFEAL